MDLLLNWLAQGVIVAILAAAALRLVPPSRAQARYAVLWTAYLLVLALPAFPVAMAIASGGGTIDFVPSAVGPVVTVPTAWWASTAAAVGLWLAWSCIQAIRLAVSALGVRDARRLGRECPASVLAHLPHWSRVSASDRRAPVILSDRVQVAAVLGCGTPTIALASSLIDQLDASDLDRVLVHEWAHVQRRDDLAQLAQRLVGLAIGWHPAAWWLERQLDFEREAACDEIAVSVTGSAKGYATCLAMLAARPDWRPAPVGALAAASPVRLRSRIVRILESPRDARSRAWRAITVGVSSGLLACTLVVADLELARVRRPGLQSSAVRRPGLQTGLNPVVRRPGLQTGHNPVVRRPGLQTGHNETSAVTSAVATTALYVPRSAPLVKPLAATSESGKRAEPAPSPVVGRVFRPGAEAAGESPAPAEALEPLPASALSVEATGSLVAIPVEAGRIVQTAGEKSWTGAADVAVEVGRASRDAGTATADTFRRLGLKLASAF